MKYTGMPSAMWMLYKKSFKNHLVTDLGFTDDDANKISKQAKSKYREIIEKLPEFEKADRFKTNIVNCAMLIAFLKSMNRRPSVEELTHFYENAMTMTATKIFCKKAGKKKFTDKDIAENKKTAALKAAERNPYSWTMDFISSFYIRSHNMVHLMQEYIHGRNLMLLRVHSLCSLNGTWPEQDQRNHILS